MTAINFLLYVLEDTVPSGHFGLQILNFIPLVLQPEYGLVKVQGREVITPENTFYFLLSASLPMQFGQTFGSASEMQNLDLGQVFGNREICEKYGLTASRW